MGVFRDRLKFCSTAALNCQNKGRYCEKELSFLLVSLVQRLLSYLASAHCVLFPPLASVTYFMNTITCAITRYIYVCILLKWCKIFQKRKCSCIIIVLHLIKCSYYSLLSQKGETWYFKQTLAKVN